MFCNTNLYHYDGVECIVLNDIALNIIQLSADL